MVKNVEAYIMSKERWKMHGKAKTPLRTKYRPELDISPKLDPVDASYYMSLVGILQWIVELVRVDICLEVSNMSSHTTLPREVQLEQLLNIFIYLKKHHNAYMVLDPSNPVVEESRFERKDRTSREFGHVEGAEELSPNIPEPHGLVFFIRDKGQEIKNWFSSVFKLRTYSLVLKEADQCRKY